MSTKVIYTYERKFVLYTVIMLKKSYNKREKYEKVKKKITKTYIHIHCNWEKKNRQIEKLKNAGEKIKQ